MNNIPELKPERVFHHFREICNIPHGTGNSEQISNYILNIVDGLELSYRRDPYGNIIVNKKGALGGEDKPPVVLQEHLDIISRDAHDFSVIDDYIYSKGTILGADGGIGIAYILSVLERDDIPHPPIEALFTVDAEDGMRGVKAMDLSVLKGRKMINFGHFNEGEMLVGAAGERRVSCEVPVRFESQFGTMYDIVICGLKGGHSGLEIDKYRGNANILMGRLLHYIDLYMEYSIFYLKGGLDHNHIPREAKASILIREKDTDRLEELIDRFNNALLKEYRFIEDNLTIYCENKDEGIANVLTEKTKQRMLFLLMTIPDGIVRMNPQFENIVQTSSNMGIMALNRESFIMHISIRSLLASEKHALSDKLKFLTETIGGRFSIITNYHAWEYNEVSELRDRLLDIHEELYGTRQLITLIHSGLECGIISDKIRDMDIVSIGPTIEYVNTEKERLCLSSVERIWDYLLKILAEI
ncbi:MAG: beta-Ala-His dipeptidase [Lachnospiraceae bacterium]|nr:beta-Ala-His dipeptidase [Lachnospiraceae bacterium]